MGYSFPPKAQPAERAAMGAPRCSQVGVLRARYTHPQPRLLTFAVIPAAGAGQRVTTGGAGAGPELAVSPAILTQAFLAGVSRMREAVPIYKHLCLQDAVWAVRQWSQEPKQRLRV